MSVLDTALLKEVQLFLIEKPDPASWSSGMWEPDEVEAYLNNSQQDLLVPTGLVLQHSLAVTIPGDLRQNLPPSWIATYCMAWQDASSGLWYPLERNEAWGLDALIPGWRYSPGRPRFWTEEDGQSLTFQIVPAPLGAGQVEILFLGNPAPLGHSGVAIEVPDDFSPCLVWGTIYRMLSKVGRAQDPARAAVAQQFADLGQAAASLILQGRG